MENCVYYEYKKSKYSICLPGLFTLLNIVFNGTDIGPFNNTSLNEILHCDKIILFIIAVGISL